MNKDYLETIRLSGRETKSLWHRIFAGVMLFVSIKFALLLFPGFFGISLVIASFGFLALGMKSYTLELLTGKEPPIEHILSKWKRAVPAACLFVVKWAYTFLWGLCFIVPGVISCLNYSLSFYVMCEDDNISAFSAMTQSKKLVYGFRTKLFFLFLLYLLLGAASLSLGAGIALIFLKFTAIFIWAAWLIGSIIAAIVLLTLVMPFMHITFAGVYLEAKAVAAPKDEVKKAPSKRRKQPVSDN